MTTYQVRFVCYQYNCGGQARNGYYNCKESFKTLEEAKKFANTVSMVIKYGNSREFINKHHYVQDGTVESLTGIFKVDVQEERIS